MRSKLVGVSPSTQVASTQTSNPVLSEPAFEHDTLSASQSSATGSQSSCVSQFSDTANGNFSCMTKLYPVIGIIYL